MYHCTLNIIVFSDDTFLQTILQKIEPLKQFEHALKCYAELSTDALQKGDIIILDLPKIINLHSLLQLRSLKKPNSSLIVCVEAAQIPLLSEAFYESIDDIFIKPFMENQILFQMNKLLSLIKLKKDLLLHQNYLNTTIDSIPDLVWFKDMRGIHVKVNDAFCHAVGKTKQDVTGRGHYYIWDLPREEYEKGEYVCLETEEIVLREKKTCLFDEKVLSKHGMRQFKTYKSPLIDDDGTILGTVGIAHDVTDWENMGTEMEIFLRSMPFAILAINDQGIIINANDKFEKYFKTTKDDMIGRDYNNWKKNSFIHLKESTADGYIEAEFHMEGTIKILEIHEELNYDVFGNQIGYLCFYQDVTVERTLEQKIINNSNTDFLTGLYNRRYFYEYVNEHRGNNPISIIYVDLDHFKKINDTYGHQVGDQALMMTSKILSQCFPNDFIARIGGDEFLITILGECEIPYLEEQATLLLQEMRRTFQASEQLKILSASIGIAQTKDPYLSIDTLIRQSDSALYEAKDTGRSRYCMYIPKNERNF